MLKSDWSKLAPREAKSLTQGISGALAPMFLTLEDEYDKVDSTNTRFISNKKKRSKALEKCLTTIIQSTHRNDSDRDVIPDIFFGVLESRTILSALINRIVDFTGMRKSDVEDVRNDIAVRYLCMSVLGLTRTRELVKFLLDGSETLRKGFLGIPNTLLQMGHYPTQEKAIEILSRCYRRLNTTKNDQKHQKLGNEVVRALGTRTLQQQFPKLMSVSHNFFDATRRLFLDQQRLTISNDNNNDSDNDNDKDNNLLNMSFAFLCEKISMRTNDDAGKDVEFSSYIDINRCTLSFWVDIECEEENEEDKSIEDDENSVSKLFELNLLDPDLVRFDQEQQTLNLTVSPEIAQEAKLSLIFGGGSSRTTSDREISFLFERGIFADLEKLLKLGIKSSRTKTKPKTKESPPPQFDVNEIHAPATEISKSNLEAKRKKKNSNNTLKSISALAFTYDNVKTMLDDDADNSNSSGSKMTQFIENVERSLKSTSNAMSDLLQSSNSFKSGAEELGQPSAFISELYTDLEMQQKALISIITKFNRRREEVETKLFQTLHDSLK
ncbi:hypothetical protein ScalyP_jg2947 [Parmales sp. scaly parma]|nr:hypothetical protein ScalyP_jg2947 [Parmales sp. scaly parma]